MISKLSNKQLKQWLSYGVGIVLMRSISIIMLPVFTAYLTLEEYGRLEVLLAFCNLGTLILGFGLVDTLYRYAGLADEKGKNIHVSELMGLAVIIAVVTFVIFQLCATNIALLLPGNIAVDYIRLLVISICVEGIIAIPLAWLRMQDNAWFFLVISLVKALLQAVLTYTLLIMGEGIQGVMIASAVSSLFIASTMFIYQIRDTGIAINIHQYRKYFSYGVPIVISGLAGFSLSGLDRWLIASYVSEEALASFAVALKFALIPLILIQPFTLWWYPKRFQLLKTQAGIEENAYYSTIGSALGVLAVGLTGMVSPMAIHYLTPQAYHNATDYLFYLLLINAIKIASDLMNVGCYIESGSQQQMKINIVCAFIGVIGFILWVPVFGVMGVIYGLGVSTVLRLLLFYFLSQKKLYLPYNFSPIYKAVTLGSMMMLIGQLSV